VLDVSVTLTSKKYEPARRLAVFEEFIVSRNSPFAASNTEADRYADAFGDNSDLLRELETE
jgi:hypothetical protein